MNFKITDIEYYASVELSSLSHVMLQTKLDKSIKNVNLLWIFLKGICYGKGTQAF